MGFYPLNGTCTACFSNCQVCSTGLTCQLCAANYVLNQAQSECVYTISSGTAAAVALGVVGAVAGVASTAFVILKGTASAAKAAFSALPSSPNAV